MFKKVNNSHYKKKKSDIKQETVVWQFSCFVHLCTGYNICIYLYTFEWIDK